MSTATAKAVLKDKTFTAFTADQGKHYAQHHANYHASVYEHILHHHTSTGGQALSLLNVGCGPGQATFTLAPHFVHTQGIDPSPAMVATARSLNPSPKTITFHATPAEDLSVVSSASVDLLTAANAAHWSDMPSFWAEAARVLKPGGSVALWATTQAVIDSDLPNAELIQAATAQHREEFLAPYIVAGNLLNRDGYQNLALPWDVRPEPIRGFDQASFHRRACLSRQPSRTAAEQAGAVLLVRSFAPNVR